MKSSYLKYYKQRMNILKIAVTFLTVYNGSFNVTNKNKKFYFAVSSNDDAFNQRTIPPAAFELGSPNKEIKRIIIEEGCFTEATYPFSIKPNFSTVGSIIRISSNSIGSQIAFTPDDGIGDLLGFTLVLHEENILSIDPVDILSIDNILLERDIARGMIFKVDEVK